jgi:hypothetical protein
VNATHAEQLVRWIAANIRNPEAEDCHVRWAVLAARKLVRDQQGAAEALLAMERVAMKSAEHDNLNESAQMCEAELGQIENELEVALAKCEGGAS